MAFFNFKNKNVFITGATSDIGISIARAYSELGANIILSDTLVQLKKLNEVKESLIAEYNNEVSLFILHLDKVEEIKKSISEFEDKINILVNCAGNNVFTPALNVNEEDWDKIIDINLKGTFFLSQSVAKKMIHNNIEGKIINIGSQHGIVANGLRTPYCVSKFGLLGLTKVLALEWSVHNILVNCVSPTYVETSKSKEFLANDNVRKAYLSKIPLKKYALPNDIAYAVLFLSSDDNKMITGENILVDGGYTIH